MAWRIDEQIVRGEIDNSTPGIVTGKIWLIGRDEPVDLKLTGNPWRDLAGHILKFTNPNPKSGIGSDLGSFQKGAVGDMTASRKVKVPECSMEELMEFYVKKQPFPWHWGNSLYLEWYSQTNGRVVIESAEYQLELNPEPAWILTEDDERAQQESAAQAMVDFMEAAGMAITNQEAPQEQDDDLPQSPEEAAADEEDARMQLLMDRVIARIEREGADELYDFDKFYKEERARYMKERGEKDPVLTPEQILERQKWIEEMNEIANEALVDLEAEKWKGTGDYEEERHPLVSEASDLAVALHHQIHDAGWVGEDAHHEHPLWEIQNCVSSASAKLAGALGMADDPDDWPPDAIIAGNVIVRLKKARDYLRDALRALESAEEESLAVPEWRHETKFKIIDILHKTQEFLSEARGVYEKPKEDESSD